MDEGTDKGDMKMKKKLLAVLLLLTVLLPCLAMAADYAIVTSGKLNLRERPSASSRSLGRYSGGTWIRLEGHPTGEWYPVTTPDGKRGYMSGTYLTFSQHGSGRATVAYAPGGYVNLRTGPSLDTGIVTRVNSGTPVTILRTTGYWYYVRLTQYGQTLEGYIHNSLINTGGTSATVVTRNGGKVNVRSGPSFSYGTLGSLSTGTRVTVLLKGTGWYWISGGGLTGFMSSGYLSEDGSRPAPVITPTPRPDRDYSIAWVNNPRSTQVLNLRESPSQSSRSLGQYYNGKQVHIISHGNTWCEVYVDGIHGYMMTQYLRFGGINPMPTATPYYDPYVEYLTPVPTATPKPSEYGPVDGGPSAGQMISLAPAAGGGSAINVYNDAKLTSLKATYSNGKQARMLQYGDNVCMIFIDGGVGYVSTWNVNY